MQGMLRTRFVESCGTSPIVVAADGGGGGNGKRKEGRRKWVIGMGRCLRVLERGSWMIPFVVSCLASGWCSRGGFECMRQPIDVRRIPGG